MIEVSENFIAYGQSKFIKEVAIPVGEEIEAISREFPCSEKQRIEFHGKPTAFASSLEALIGITVFFGGWAAKKFLDEIYDAKFGPVVKDKLRAYINSDNESKKYSLSISLNKKNKLNSVFICCVGSNLSEIEESEKHIPAIIDISERYIDSTNEGKVYMFIIDNGVCELTPAVFDNYDHAINGLKKHYPIKSMRYVR
jgi:hypothetical protein